MKTRLVSGKAHKVLRSYQDIYEVLYSVSINLASFLHFHICRLSVAVAVGVIP
jgi:hypothetical protein